MVPKKTKDIIKKIAQDNHIDEAFIEDVVSFYWKELRIKLSNIKHARIFVPEFGTFTIRESRVDRYIKDFGSYVAKMGDIKYASTEKKRSMRAYYKALLNVKQQVDEEKKRQAIFKKERDGKKTTGDMGQ